MNRRRERGEQAEPITSPADLGLIDRVVHINRVAKVVKGGRNFSFNAIVIVGDGKGHVGIGMGKAREVMEAITKGTEIAKRSMKCYPMLGQTLPHPIVGKFGAARVVMKPASEGTGVIAGGPVRAVMECLGVRDVLTKCIGSRNPHNLVKATMNGLENIENLEKVAYKRNMRFREVFEP